MEKDGALSIGSLLDFYLESPAGQAFLKARFGLIRQEYGHWIGFLSEEAQKYRDFRITGVLDDNAPGASGFYGATYRSPEGFCVTAFRGSEIFGIARHENDYRNDFALSYQAPTAQQRMVDVYLKKFPPADSFWLTGHSLGGNLALYAAIAMPGYLWGSCKGCFALNAPGFCGEFLDKYRGAVAARSERIHPLQNEHDIVSSLLRNAVEPEIVASACDPSAGEGFFSILYPHSNFQFAKEEDGSFKILVGGEKSGLCRMANYLTELVLALPIFLRRELAENLLDAVYGEGFSERQMRSALLSLEKTLARHAGEPSALPAVGVAYAAELPGYEASPGVLRAYQASKGPFRNHELAHVQKLLLRLAFEGIKDPVPAAGQEAAGRGIDDLMARVARKKRGFVSYKNRLATCREMAGLIDRQGGPKTEQEHYFRNKLNTAPGSLEEMLAEIKNPKDINWRLMPVEKSGYHMFGENGAFNLKFLSDNGIFEAVYNMNGDLLTEENDPENMGTLNYANPETNPVKHLVYDITPYYLWGNTLPAVRHGRLAAAENIKRFYEDEEAIAYREKIERLIEEAENGRTAPV
jgi:hypothetical protein